MQIPLQTRMHSPAILVIALMGCIALCADSQSVNAQEKQKSAKAAENSSNKKPVKKERKRPGNRNKLQSKSLTFEQEAELAIAFARKHHPKLADLVEHLKTNNPQEYRRAIKDLSNDYRRLDRMKNRSEKEMQLELSAWKLDSRIRLLAARFTMEADPDLEREIKDLLRQRIEVRLARLEMERNKLLQRLDRVDELVSQMESKSDQLVDSQWKRLQKQLNLENRSNRKRLQQKPGKQSRNNSKQ